MKVIIAPDSFKECLSAPEVADTLARELVRLFPGREVVKLPLSDGGEGFSEIIGRNLGACRVNADVTGPLGEPVKAGYARKGNLAILDVASVCGLSLVKPEDRNPLKTTSKGVGELLLKAYEDGCRKAIIGLGGSATSDGGKGILDVTEGLEMEIHALCDVSNPFVGSSGAARVFGPQKGATPEMVEILESRMVSLAALYLKRYGVNVADLPGAGAAGGIGGALAAGLGATLESGIDAVLDLLHFEEVIEGADIIVTGEGKSDGQTLSGKVPFGVLRRSGNIPVVLVSGTIRDASALRNAGFHRLIEVSPRNLPLEEALKADIARANLEQAARRIVLEE